MFKTAGKRTNALNESIESFKNFSMTAIFDIFLSYRSLDAELAVALANSFQTEFGYKVYLDRWIDPDMNPSSANRETAKCIRARLQHSKCLIYADTAHSCSSRWMPWEAGFMDGQNRPVAILPIEQTENEAKQEAHKGLEYLSLYPYISKNPIMGKTEMTLWINETIQKYCRFDDWLKNGKQPYIH